MVFTELTKKQQIFVDEYLIDLNATRAYKAAYPATKKDETAASLGARMIRNDKVAGYVNKRMKDRVKRTEITQDKVLKEIAIIAFSKVSDYAKVIEKQAVFTTEEGAQIQLYDKEGNPVMVKDVDLTLTDQLADEQQRALSGIKRGKNGIEVATCDKVKALELLGRHLGMFTDKHDLTGDLGLNIIIDYGDADDTG